MTRVPFITNRGEWLGVLNVDAAKHPTISLPVLFERNSRVFAYSRPDRDGDSPEIPAMQNIHIMSFRREQIHGAGLRWGMSTTYVYVEEDK